MTTYRLPDGTEATATLHGEKAWVEHTTLGKILVDADKLAEVKPPLPPVPDVLAVAVGDHVFVLDHIATTPVFICPGACHPHPLDWAELNELAAAQGKPIIPLTPDLADDAPALPWTEGADETEDKVHTSHGNVYIHITPGYVLPEEAELRAAVILRGVREARAAREAEKP